ncbi:MAG: hypothetical protein CM15mP109_09120 [Candidatus Dadabacteria bacterium]|nr:MAG: hypothetical protein CM15mP109_09120 [Candidatus Dadabacteria bacterium]
MNEKIDWPSKKYAWFFTTLLLITYTVSFIDRAMINLLIDPIRSDLKTLRYTNGSNSWPWFHD